MYNLLTCYSLSLSKIDLGNRPPNAQAASKARTRGGCRRGTFEKRSGLLAHENFSRLWKAPASLAAAAQSVYTLVSETRV